MIYKNAQVLNSYGGISKTVMYTHDYNGMMNFTFFEDEKRDEHYYIPSKCLRINGEELFSFLTFVNLVMKEDTDFRKSYEEFRKRDKEDR